MRIITTMGALAGVLMIVMLAGSPAVAADNAENADNVTYIQISIESGGDVNATFKVDAGGTVTTWIDGVPVEEKFSSLESAIDSLNRRLGGVSGGVSVNSSRIVALSKALRNAGDIIGQNRTMILIHENKLEIVLGNTIYNKQQHEALERRYENFLENFFTPLENTVGNHSVMLLMHDNRITLVFQNTLYNQQQHAILEENFETLENEFYRFVLVAENKMDKLESRAGALEDQRNYAVVGAVLLAGAVGSLKLIKRRRHPKRGRKKRKSIEKKK